jgi:16S rRNA A1518/A1519 N6-dimethyltransferase RsmA/KsgA/DIM1 with predicted DNA glycosylase/AP lyase activity
MLRSALGELFDGTASESIASAGIDPTVRGEVLLLGDFMKIANTLAI